MTRSILGTLALGAAALVVAGCQQGPPALVPVSGTVTVNGQPLPNALVTFTPKIQGYGADYIAMGTTDDKGHYQASCPGKEGVAAAESIVTVVDAPAPDNTRGMSGESQTALARYSAGLKNRPIPADYQSLAKTPLTLTIKAGQTEYNLELKR